MQPRHYLDFSLPESGRGAGLPAPVLAGALLKILHGAFSQNPGRYALALPKHAESTFAVLRVFAGERDDLDDLVQSVESHPLVRDYIRLGYPRKIPANFAGPWVAFRRYRIPTRRSGRKPDDDLRERRIRRADDARLPYFILHSRSNGQQFGLYVEIAKSELPLLSLGAGQSEGNLPDCHPDSYGLSVASRPFSLPDLPA